MLDWSRNWLPVWSDFPSSGQRPADDFRDNNFKGVSNCAMKNRYLVLACGSIAVFGLSSCADHYLADVSLNDAMTQFGRINSHDLPIGTVLLWHKKTNEIDQFTSIPKSSVPLARIPATGTEEQTAIQGVSETDIAVSTPPSLEPSTRFKDHRWDSGGCRFGNQPGTRSIFF